jgi:hypothetical protein
VSQPPDDRDLDALLRQPAERLAPPDGSWDQITRRARRRKWAKASASVAAGLVIVSGAVPAVIAVRHNSDDQTLQVADTASPHQSAPTSTSLPAPLPSLTASAASVGSLTAFKPSSSTFISQGTGFLIGTSRAATTVAKTTDGGATWAPIAKVPGNGHNLGIRFADSADGYIFGRQLAVTSDGGLTWVPQSAPGYIDDLETMNGQIWATVRSCQGCGTVSLYSAPVGDPVLQRVTAVPQLPGNDSTLVVSNKAVYLLVQDKSTKQGQLWATPNGSTWTQRGQPCPGYAVARIAAWSTTGLAAVCDQLSYLSTPATVRESTDRGTSWTTQGQIAGVDPDLISAGSVNDLVVTQGGVSGEPYVSTNGGQSFTAVHIGTQSMGFVGFISPTHVVAISSATGPDRAFLTSHNAGATWTVTSFP